MAPASPSSAPCGYAGPFFSNNPGTPGLGETDPEAKLPCRVCHFDHQDMYCVRLAYDAQGRVVRETDEATRGETRVSYAPGRETIEYFLPDGRLDRKHLSVFDAAGRLVQDWSERDGKPYGLFRREYDAEGHLITLVDTQGFDKPADQDVFRFGWEKGRLVTEDLGDGRPLSTMRRWTHTFSPDGCVETIERRPFPWGKLHSTETVRRDALGRIISTVVVGGGSHPKKATFEYEGGKLVRETTSWGDDAPLVTRYAWDEKGRIKGWSNDGGDQTSFEYECPSAASGG
jgi:YD repeat-containing protein